MGRTEIHVGFRWETIRGKKLLGRPRRRWEDNIIMQLREIRWDYMDWIHVVQDREQ
jgi:hypothetical protein